MKNADIAEARGSVLGGALGKLAFALQLLAIAALLAVLHLLTRLVR